MKKGAGMRLHLIMHEGFESPGAILDWAVRKDHSVSYTRLFAGEPLPQELKDIDFLIVMGGPQSPATTLEQCPYFDAAKEIEFLRSAIASDKLILGICLGAQLLGEAFGAPFEHSPHKEIGVFELTLTSAAEEDPIISKFPKSFPVAHWHGDMPGLTPESKVLARSEGCPRQIVRYRKKVYGFQCHFEFTLESIEGMIENCAHELVDAAISPYIQNAEQLRNHNYQSCNELLFSFLDYMEALQ